MKRIVLALAAVAAVTVPLAAATEAMAQGRYNDREWRDNRGGYDRWDNDRRDNRGRGNNGWDNGRRGNDRWDDNRRGNDRWDNDRRYNNRWNDRNYNGYYLGNRWYYGPPPVAYYGRNDYRPGFQAWRRGQRLPNYYQSYVVYDYQRYRLRPPPRGHHWVRHNNDYILAAIATGLILEVISNGF